MKSSHSSPRVLIGGHPGIYENYESALHQSGFFCLYAVNTQPYIYSSVSELSYDLLLLPGGGDIPADLYLSEHDTYAASYDPTQCSPPEIASDLLQFLLLQSALAQNKPVLGICKGMQIINVFFGGDLYPHLPTAERHCYIDADQSHTICFASEFPDKVRLFGRKTAPCDALRKILASSPIVNSAHHQGVRRLGKDLVTLQYSEDFLPETIAHQNLPILGLQWHPERLPGFCENSFGKLIRLLLQCGQL